MNTREIAFVLKNYPMYTFKDVCARNRLPRRTNVPCTLVANTDPDDRKGQHWIAMYIDKDRRGEYYDPYGIPPFHSVFVNFLNKQCVVWTYNPIQVQHMNSLVCGQHCIYYLIQRSRGNSMQQITEMLQKDLYANTFFVDDFVQRLTYRYS